MATEGGHASEYDPLLTPRLRAEAVRVIRGFSFAGGHVVVVGGLVPSLLVPDPQAGIDRHIGTQDLDLCLSIALVEGNVGNYDRLGAQGFVTVEAFGDRRFAGHVVDIGHRMGRKNVRTDEPTERIDTEILEVVMELDDAEELVPGLRVMGFLSPSGRAPAPH